TVSRDDMIRHFEQQHFAFFPIFRVIYRTKNVEPDRRAHAAQQPQREIQVLLGRNASEENDPKTAASSCQSNWASSRPGGLIRNNGQIERDVDGFASHSHRTNDVV